MARKSGSESDASIAYTDASAILTGKRVRATAAACRALYYLARHDFAVDAADVDAGVDAGFVVGVDDVAPEGLIGTGSAVVRSLKTKKMHLNR